MRTENEIREKITQKMDELYAVKTDIERQDLYGIIDALLWVIEDESGEPI